MAYSVLLFEIVLFHEKLNISIKQVRITKLAAIVSLYRYEEQMNEYVLLTLYSVHVYLALELVLAAAAAASRALVGLELEPRFDRPYLSALLRDFWCRRWNLFVPALLRQRVFGPVRARLGAPVGVLAAFVVSGVMHEAMFSYVTLHVK
jgi:D-alanyl-lipoteichoic acid acyltransferase DltB (MBOAT superfamily)